MKLCASLFRHDISGILKSGELVGQLFLFSHLQTICKQALLSNTCSAQSPMHFARVCLSSALKAIMLVNVNNDVTAAHG